VFRDLVMLEIVGETTRTNLSKSCSMDRIWFI